MRAGLALCALAAAALTGPAHAQPSGGLALGTSDAPPGLAAGRIVVIDRDRMLSESRSGRAMLEALDRESRALLDENRAIEERLRGEERALTEARDGMEPEAFRAEAEAFDARVQAIRAEQEGKSRDLVARREAMQARFWERAIPVLAEIMAERGAVVVLDRSTVFLSSDTADITDDAVARLDRDAAPAPGAALGIGIGAEPGPEPEPGAEAEMGAGAGADE